MRVCVLRNVLIRLNVPAGVRTNCSEENLLCETLRRQEQRQDPSRLVQTLQSSHFLLFQGDGRYFYMMAVALTTGTLYSLGRMVLYRFLVPWFGMSSSLGSMKFMGIS